MKNLEITVNTRYPQMATIDEAAKIFHLPPHFIRSRARQGANWVIKSGRKYLVNLDRFAAFLNGDMTERTED